MAKKTTRKKPAFQLDKGVGIKWDINENGWGLNSGPHLAILHHPLTGIAVWGPFVDEDAAHRWIRDEGDGTAMHYFGRAGESRWYTQCLYVPTHPAGDD